jgi:Concanavalin A-like lectin/glucanases superfamily
VEDVNGVDYTWKRQSDDVTVGGNSPVLTLTDVQQSNEDSYCCIVENASGEDVSEWAVLWTKRLIARWEFEDNLNDSEADGWDGVYVDPNMANEPPTPGFVLDPCSIDGGKALQLTADELHVRITDSEDYFNFYPMGYTVNVWVKTEVSGIWGAIASKQHRGDWPDFIGWVISCNNEDYASNALRQVFGSSTGAAIIGTSNIVDNEWHMITGTYNAETGEGSIYVDGKLENQLVDTLRTAPINNQPVVIGAETVSGAFSHDGLLDKMSIYSYAISPLDVAVLYTDVTGEDICLEYPEYDFNEDCEVDLQDFAVFVGDWLECNLVPDCLP